MTISNQLLIKLSALFVLFTLTSLSMSYVEAKSCGELNQPACPKIKLGYPCKGKLEPDSNNICKPCGGANQTPCRALKLGKQCDDDLIIMNDRCVACGNLDQPACPKIKLGYPCKGQLEPDSNNICKPCGALNQQACRALKEGPQCDDGLTVGAGGICQESEINKTVRYAFILLVFGMCIIILYGAYKFFVRSQK